MVDIKNIPARLKSDCQFCVWKFEKRSGQKTKMPYNPANGERAKINDMRTFADFKTTLMTYAIGGYDGIGIAVGNGIGAFDIDHCFREDGTLNDTAATVLSIFPTAYVEKSPSGKGLRGFFGVPEDFVYDKTVYYINNRSKGLEVYMPGATNRFVTVTGDVYRTGEIPNDETAMLSSELATLLSGRYTEIKMLPLSFREYMAVTGMAKEEAFAEFMKTGGIPYVAVMNRTDEKIDQYLEGIYNTVIVKDIEQRQARREKEGGKRKITDIALLKTIARYLASVIGSPVSMKSITDYLTSAGRKVSQNTVSDYVEALTESFIFYPVERFDIVGKQLLKVNNKFYMVDMGIRNHILPRKRYDLGFTIENIVYLELSRRGGKVNIGKYGSTEVDFVTQKEGVLKG